MAEFDVGGIVLLLVSLVCLGTWPALLRHASCISRSHLAYVYIDYATAYGLTSLLPYVVWRYRYDGGVDSDSPKALAESLVFVSMMGGALLSCGNLSLQWATSYYKASLTTVLAIQASLTVMLGTSINYFLEPEMNPRPQLLLLGVLSFGLAICTAAHLQLVSTTTTGISAQEDTMQPQLELNAIREQDGDLNHGYAATSTTDACFEEGGRTLHFNELVQNDVEQIRSSRDNSLRYNSSRANRTGVWIAVGGGLCFGFFSPCFNIAVNDPFRWAGSPELTLPTSGTFAVVYGFFGLSFWLTSIIGNAILLHLQTRCGVQPALCLNMMSHCQTLRAWSGFAGIICGLGNVLQFQGGQRVGYATADLVQAYPLVSTVWDALWFNEFQNIREHRSLCFQLVGMYVAYMVGIVLLAASASSEE